MYSLKVIAHSASGKSILATLSKKRGIFQSQLATGNVSIPNVEDMPAVGEVIELGADCKWSTRTSIAEQGGQEFVWLALE